MPFLTQLARQVAIAIENARSFGEVSEQNKLTQEKLYLEDEIRSELKFEKIVARSDSLRKVLIYGETGSRLQLGPREQEIVRMVAQGHSNKVIADVLSISSRTVCTHLRRIFAKLGVGSRAAMVAQFLGNSSPRRAGLDLLDRLPSCSAVDGGGTRSFPTA